MIYLDSSPVLAQVLSESNRPAAQLWAAELASSRLSAYEADPSVLEEVDEIWARVLWLELQPHVLQRALQPFPKLPVVRTLDALHLASADYLRAQGAEVEFATYDKRLAAGARALGFPLAKL